MCTICIDDDVTTFVFPRDDETIDHWIERLVAHDGIAFAMMYHDDIGLEQIASSYQLQGFTHNAYKTIDDGKERPWFNVLLIRDLIFVTYGHVFAKMMGWETHRHDV
jgi:hypothetical protein